MEQNQQWTLPQKFWCYKRSYEQLLETKQLFKILFLEYSICFKCIFRIYSFQHPRLYNDPSFYLEILPSLLDVCPENQLYAKYNVSQCCMQKICWLCQQIFQRSYLNFVLQQIKQMIETKGYSEWQQFKLNIRIPNIIFLRNILLCRFIYYQLVAKGATAEQLPILYNILILPIETKKYIDPKTVLKWLLATELNQNTKMTSTSDDHPQNLVISLEQEYQDNGSQSNIMRHFSSFLGLQKKKEKSKGRKVCLDLLGQEKQRQPVHHTNTNEYRCNSNNMNKIIALKQNDFVSIFDKIIGRDQFWQLMNCNQQQNELCGNITHKLFLFTKNVYLCGRYIKFSRYLSQTPWLINGKKLTEGSLQQQIQDKIFKLFYPTRTKQQIQTKFHSGGREDIDVRMLQGGRPFVLQFCNPIRSINSISVDQVFEIAPQSSREFIREEYAKWLNAQKNGNCEQLHSWRIVKLMELLINADNLYVQVLDLQQTTQSFISVELKAAEMQKIKHYLCYIYSMQPLTRQDKQKLQILSDIPLQQLTPLRVLHRRTLLSRQKMIHRLKMHLVSCHSAILEVWASAGTYIKEFVHGDLGRTLPNIGSILNKEVDILQLDVGSLKEGQWKEGDEQKMKMEKFEWMD